MLWILIAVIAICLICFVLLGLAIRDLSERLEVSNQARKTVEADMDKLQRQFDAQERLLVELMHQDAA